MIVERRPHLPALDGLRGLAVVAVVQFHAGHLVGGYLGVDLFFVLSGFLITTLLLDEQQRGRGIAFGAFWARRARRLLPALGLMLLGVAVCALTLASPAQVATLRGDALATLGYVANWRAIASGHDYWALFRSPSLLEHTWSLAIEEQFYLVWPLVVAGVAFLWRRAVPRALLTLSVVGVAGSYALTQLFSHAGNNSRAYYGTDTRAGSILLGAALAAGFACTTSPRSRRRQRSIGTAGWVGVALLAVAWTHLGGDDPFLYRFGFLACGLSAVAVIATASQLPTHALTRTLSWRPLCALGLISYGVYLWHWPIDVIVDSDRIGLDGWPLIGVQWVLTLALATASYHLVEQPIRTGWGNRRVWRLAVPALAAGLAGLLIVSTSGASVAAPRSPAIQLTRSTFSTRNLEIQRSKLNRFVEPTAPRLVLGGDSVAFSLALGAHATRDSSFVVANVAILGCGIGAGVPIDLKFASPARLCHQWPTIWRRAIRVFHPKAIALLSGTWDMWPRRVDGRSLPMYSNALRHSLFGSLETARGIAADAGIPLLELTMPCLHPTPAEIAGIGAGLGERKRVAWINGVYRDFARRHRDVVLLDLGTYACAHRPDPLEDGVHFSPAGARAAWKWLTPRVLVALASGAQPSPSR
jgi:Predicted acyltransferases